MISTTERRQYEPPRVHARVPCTIPVELTHDERMPGFEADAVDLSAGGLSLRSTSLPEVGATLHCRFDTLPGGTRISGRGEVVWAQPSGERSGEFGLRFTQIDPRAQALISEMIAERVATGGVSAKPQPRMATLEFEENEGPITAKLTRATGRDVVFEQPLDVLALGRGVVAHADTTLGHGNILRVDLRMDNGTPTLALTVRFSHAQEEFGEYDWGDPESGTQPRTAPPEFLSPSELPPEVDTVPDLAAPLGVYDERDSQPPAAAADGGNALESPRVMTHAGGTLAPSSDGPALPVPTRAGGMLAPAPGARGGIDPLSQDATNAALARIAAEERAQQLKAELGTPLAAVLAASGATRASSPGSLHASAPGSLPAAAPRSLSESAPGSLPATSPGRQLTADSELASAPGALRDVAPSSLQTFAPGSQRAYGSDTQRDALNALAARHTPPHDASYPAARDTEPSAEPDGRTTPTLYASVTPVRDTDPTSEPGARLTPPLDARHTPAPPSQGSAAHGSSAVHSAGGAGLAGTGHGRGSKQMDLTFAGGDETDFADLDEYELHADDEHGVRRYEAIAVLNDETLSDPDDVRHTAPMRLKAQAEPGWGPTSEPDESLRFSTTAGDAWSPVTDVARKSALVRFLRIFAALVDGIQTALGIGSRALQRISASVVPVLRRQLVHRSTMRGVGARARRSAGSAPAAAPSWKLPRGSGRLVLLAVLMIACGVLLVYAFPQAGSDQIDLHRQVQAEPDDQAEAHAAELAANAATGQPEAAAAQSGELGAASAKALLTAGNAKAAANAKPAPALGQAARAASDGLTAGTTVFGYKQVPNAQRFVLRTSSPITALHGKSDPGGFTVILPNTRALDKAAPIALANHAVSRAKILNRGGYAELNVRFAEGRNPAYRISAQPSGLEVLIGQ